ncbi:erythromycin esterase family protein [Phytoactinopolyspora halotolerans]|uniref:Erythromycin esterase family protein n=1 Tax=Phytoactinopolyspora halotolerans TaxID=1981512 RepID=A0A6L9SCB6_9ACTN|nr:erythromycin esterase family protein [Phytoactinopolyspora halotolerans]NEE02324.1 erythromycin esterase family protein [Phytoactinopolyspora halotolerans]
MPATDGTPATGPTSTTVNDIRDAAHPLHATGDLDPLLAHIGDARHVLIGEASHGTSEFYRWRAELTRRLIAEDGFSFVAVEGDWPDCHRVHLAVTRTGQQPVGPIEALRAYRRWPTWMWANEEVAEFVRWLRRYNDEYAGGAPAGFHGMDVYSLWDSLFAIQDYAREYAPDALEAAQRAYECFEPYREDPHTYAWAGATLPDGCRADVVALLANLRAQDGRDTTPAGALTEQFVAEQNAAVVAEAERYYRTVVRGGGESWNVRDHHMVDTYDRLLRAYGPQAKGVIWAHNTHLGDARFTDMAASGMVNVGQLMRQRHGPDGVVLVGMGTHRGTVTAADRWEAPARTLDVPPARDGSVEAEVHGALGDHGDSLFVFSDPAEQPRDSWLRRVYGHRAIGVVYDPAREHRGNYVPSVLGRRYDAFLYLDRTSALHPLRPADQRTGEKEAYPTGV